MCAQLSGCVLSGAGQVSFVQEQVDKFRCWVLMHVSSGIPILVNGSGVAKAQQVVESCPHHQMRGSGGPRVGETGRNRWETGGCDCRWRTSCGKSYLDIGYGY